MTAWRDVGVPDPVEAGRWAAMGLAPAAAAPWVGAGIDAEEASAWIQAGFTPDEALIARMELGARALELYTGGEVVL